MAGRGQIYDDGEASSLHGVRSYPLTDLDASMSTAGDASQPDASAAQQAGPMDAERSGASPRASMAGEGQEEPDLRQPNVLEDDRQLPPEDSLEHPAPPASLFNDPEAQVQAEEGGDSFPADALAAGDLSSQSSGPVQRQNSWALRDAAVCKQQAVTYSWGRGDLGQLGLGPSETCLSPTKIDGLEGRDIVHAAGNLFNSAFLTGDGDLLTCGANDDGQLGVKGRECSSIPIRVAALDAVSVHHAAMGQSHTVAVVGDGMPASWGANELGQLGQGREGPDVAAPRLLKKLPGQSNVRVATGESHTLLLTSAGLVSAAGHNSFGQLGVGDGEIRAAATEVGALWMLGVVQIACGSNHSAALTASGSVLTWGRGKYGQLGLGDFANTSHPRAVQLPGSTRIIQIACGGDHMLAGGAHGEACRWGRGTWGQTGHGSLENLSFPRRIQALDGQRVVQASAGARHSLVLTAAGEVFAFGNGELGQLGLGDQLDRSSPTRLPPFSAGVPAFVVAAGDHSLAVCRRSPTEAAFVVAGPQDGWGAGLMPLKLPNLESLAVAANKDTQELATLKHTVEDMFANPGYLIAQVAADSDESPLGHGLDLLKVTNLYTSLLRVYDSDLLDKLMTSAGRLADRIWEYNSSSSAEASPAGEALWMRAIFVLLQNPLNSEGPGKQLMKKVIRAASVCRGKKLLMAWLRTLAPEVFAARNVRPLQKYLASVAARQEYGGGREDFILGLHLLLLMHNANEKGTRIIQPTEFYNANVSDLLDLRYEYLTWLRIQDEQRQKPAKGGTELVSVCQTPFCLTPDAKSKVLQIEASMQKQAHFQSGSIQALMHGIHPAHLQFLDLKIRREHLLEDAVAQIRGRSPHDLKKPLRVTFASGGVPEEGLDQGGVTKEFFQLLILALFNEAYGMFTLDPQTRTFWFNFKAMDTESEFRLVGSLIGLAVYSSVILDVHFPQVVYKKLLRQPLGFEDLKAAFPELGKGLQALLDFEGDVEGVFCRTFSVEYDYFGEMRTHPLKPGGADIPVTAENRDEFVQLYTKWLLHDSIQTQFAAFAYGFHEVCGGPALTLFRPDELELLVCGLPHLDFEDLHAAARYDGGYHQDHPTVKAFWQVLQSLSLAEKKLFLKFTTGCDRAPVGGLGHLELVIQRSGPDTESLPTAHTCFNYLLLPEYKDADKLRRKLMTAINNAEGFGLQ